MWWSRRIVDHSTLNKASKSRTLCVSLNILDPMLRSCWKDCDVTLLGTKGKTMIKCIVLKHCVCVLWSVAIHLQCYLNAHTWSKPPNLPLGECIYCKWVDNGQHTTTCKSRCIGQMMSTAEFTLLWSEFPWTLILKIFSWVWQNLDEKWRFRLSKLQHSTIRRCKICFGWWK